MQVVRAAPATIQACLGVPTLWDSNGVVSRREHVHHNNEGGYHKAASTPKSWVNKFCQVLPLFFLSVDIAFSFFRFDFYFLQYTESTLTNIGCNLAVFLGPSVRIYAFPGNLINSSSHPLFSLWDWGALQLILYLKVGFCLKKLEAQCPETILCFKIDFLNNSLSGRHTCIFMWSHKYCFTKFI